MSMQPLKLCRSFQGKHSKLTWKKMAQSGRNTRWSFPRFGALMTVCLSSKRWWFQPIRKEISQIWKSDLFWNYGVKKMYTWKPPPGLVPSKYLLHQYPKGNIRSKSKSCPCYWGRPLLGDQSHINCVLECIPLIRTPAIRRSKLS